MAPYERNSAGCVPSKVLSFPSPFRMPIKELSPKRPWVAAAAHAAHAFCSPPCPQFVIRTSANPPIFVIHRVPLDSKSEALCDIRHVVSLRPLFPSRLSLSVCLSRLYTFPPPAAAAGESRTLRLRPRLPVRSDKTLPPRFNIPHRPSPDQSALNACPRWKK